MNHIYIKQKNRIKNGNIEKIKINKYIIIDLIKWKEEKKKSFLTKKR